MSDVHTGVGAYVTDALKPAERAAFERHLDDCSACRTEVDELTATVTELGHLVARPAPSELRAAVLTSIGSVRPLPPLTGARDLTAADGLGGALPPAQTTDPSAMRTRGGHDRLTPRRPALPRGGVNNVLAAVAAASVLVALVTGGWAMGMNRQLNELRGADAQTRAEASVLSAPDARLRSVALSNGGRGVLIASPSVGRAWFQPGSLPDPGTGRVYQLWTLQGSSARPDATFAADQQRVWLHGDLASTEKVAITIEPTGGSSSPTGTVLGAAQV